MRFYAPEADHFRGQCPLGPLRAKALLALSRTFGANICSGNRELKAEKLSLVRRYRWDIKIKDNNTFMNLYEPPSCIQPGLKNYNP